MNIAIVRNISHEGPGLLKQVADRRGDKVVEIDLSRDLIMPDLNDFDGLIMLGGPDSVNDNSTKIKTALSITKQALDLNKPYLGICLGLQLLVKAAGGEIIKNSIAEHGLLDPIGNQFNIKLTAAGRQSTLFKQLPDNLDVFHLHGETVELTEDMTLLATGKYCESQVVRIGSKAYGLQCHFELTEEMLSEWISIDPDLQKLNKSELERLFNDQIENYTRTGKQLFNNFLDSID